MIGSWVYLKVGGQTCIGWIADNREGQGCQWVLIEPIVGFCQETWRSLADIQYVF
jgi:hypothetical protein